MAGYGKRDHSVLIIMVHFTEYAIMLLRLYQVELKPKAKRLQLTVPTEQLPENSSTHSAGPPVILKSNTVSFCPYHGTFSIALLAR